MLTPGLILAVPIFDSLTVAWLRVTHGRSVFQGGIDHPSHRLVALGLSERRAVLLLYGLSALSGVAGLMAWQLEVLPGVVLGALIGLGFVALGVVLAEVRVGIRALRDYLVSQRQTGVRTLIAGAGGEGAACGRSA